MSLPTIAEQLALNQVSPTTFRSTHLPQRMGNGLPIAYGGCTAAYATHAACLTVPIPMHIYSMMGSFHGPTRIDRGVNCRVECTRDTKTFCTRRVVASQTQDDGSERTCAEVLVEFQVKEPAMLEYSVPPAEMYSTGGPMDAQRTATNGEVIERLVRAGAVTQVEAEAHKRQFAMAEAFFETRQCLAGVSAQNLMGVAKHVRTTQAHLPVYERTSAEWLRCKISFGTAAENAAALAFIMDGALSFLPINLVNKNFSDAGACSTLDFALRIMVPDFQVGNWHLRERRAISAAVGRTYSESRYWDENGTLVAVESQTGILRPLPEEKGKTNEKAKI